MSQIITLLTDFGLKDPYVAVMKGVILKINPNVNIVDITHEVPNHDIFYAALTLWSAYKFFPKNTIHVVVVDPGVGTERKPIVIKSKNYFFIGPDNGVLSLAASEDEIQDLYEINLNSKYVSRQISYTFHGRDVFAPAAAYLSLGVSLSEIGKRIKHYKIIKLPKYSIEDNSIIGKVIYIDKFGNVVTNIPSEVISMKLLSFNKEYIVKITERNLNLKVKLVKAYSQVPPGTPLLIPDSFNFLELSINMGNASKKFNIKINDEIVIEW